MLTFCLLFLLNEILISTPHLRVVVVVCVNIFSAHQMDLIKNQIHAFVLHRPACLQKRKGTHNKKQQQKHKIK